MGEAVKAILEGFFILLSCRKELLKKLLFPFGILCICSAIRALVPPGGVVSWLLVVIEMVLMAVMAVTVHRVVVLGVASLPEWGIGRLTLRELQFIGYEIAVFGGVFAIYAIIVLPYYSWIAPRIDQFWLFAVGNILCFLLLYVVAMRFFLVFPGTAVEDNPGLRGSWELTRNYKIFLFIVVGVLPGLLWGVSELIFLVPGLVYLAVIVNTLIYVLEVAALSVAYIRIRGRPDKGGASTWVEL